MRRGHSFLNLMKFIARFLVALCFLASYSLGAKEAANLSESHTEVACQFETSFRGKDGTQREGKYVWRMWRAKREVEVYQVGSKDGEAWMLDGAGGVILGRILHPERTEVRFDAMQLRILGQAVDWSKCCSLVSLEFLESALTFRGEGSFLGRPVREFSGQVGSEKWNVLWSSEDKLAVSIEVENEKTVSRTVLQERHELNAKPWERLRDRGYESIDYTDLGDGDTNPKIRRIMTRLGIKCSHKSCGPVCLTPQP